MCDMPHFTRCMLSSSVPRCFWNLSPKALISPFSSSVLSQPVLRSLLERMPQLAKATDVHGVSALHLAARSCADDFVAELLRAGAHSRNAARAAAHFCRREPPSATARDYTRCLCCARAGASPLAATHGGERTPLDEAMTKGCMESLVLMLRALRPAARHVAMTAVAEYAVLPGTAISTRSLSTLLPPSWLHAAVGKREGNPLRRSHPVLDAAPPEVAATCSEGGGWDVEPPPTEAERRTCELDQLLPSLSAEKFFKRYYELSRPVSSSSPP